MLSLRLHCSLGFTLIAIHVEVVRRRFVTLKDVVGLGLCDTLSTIHVERRAFVVIVLL